MASPWRLSINFIHSYWLPVFKCHFAESSMPSHKILTNLTNFYDYPNGFYYAKF